MSTPSPPASSPPPPRQPASAAPVGAGPPSLAHEEAFARYGTELAAAVRVAIGPWVVEAVRRRLGGPMTGEVETAALAAGAEAAADVGARLDQLLALDLDSQWTNPLSIIRTATTYPTRLLQSLSVPPVPRDRHAQRLNPQDLYDLTPAAFADLGPEVHERGLVWGAAKAHLHLSRRTANDST